MVLLGCRCLCSAVRILRPFNSVSPFSAGWLQGLIPDWGGAQLAPSSLSAPTSQGRQFGPLFIVRLEQGFCLPKIPRHCTLLVFIPKEGFKKKSYGSTEVSKEL